MKILTGVRHHRIGRSDSLAEACVNTLLPKETAPRAEHLPFLRMAIMSLCAWLSACSDVLPIRNASIGTVKGEYSTAEYRLISQRRRAQKEADQDILCSEPSPDIAKAFSTAASANVAAGKTTVGMSVAQSQAIAQLGKRYATVELLRDIRFRDCEDYSNGILDKVEYGYRLSRFSGLVVTLFGMEMTSLMVITDVERSLETGSRALNDLFGLTPTELALARELLRGVSTKQAAVRLNIRLTRTAGGFAGGCNDSRLGIGSRRGVFLGKTTGAVNLYAGIGYYSTSGGNALWYGTMSPDQMAPDVVKTDTSKPGID